MLLMLHRVSFFVAAASALSCSDPPQPVAKGAVSAVIASAPGKTCPSGLTINIKQGDTGVTRTVAAGLVEDGESGATISCSVKRSGTVEEGGNSFTEYAVTVSAAQGPSSFSFSGTAVEYGDASIVPIPGSVRGTGVGSGAAYAQGTRMQTMNADTCTLDVMEVASGRIHAGFSCLRMGDPGFAAQGCSILDTDRSAFAFLECGD